MSNRDIHSDISENKDSPIHESHTVRQGYSEHDTNNDPRPFDETSVSEDEYNRRESLRRMWNNVAADSEE